MYWIWVTNASWFCWSLIGSLGVSWLSVRWRYWLLDVPAFIVTIWYRVYLVVIALASLMSVAAVMALLVLWLFGIRWDW